MNEINIGSKNVINQLCKLFLCIVMTFCISAAVGCNDEVVNLLSAGTDVCVGCWYDDDVLIYEGSDLFKGRHILDYNTAEGQAFAKFNKINYQDVNYDYKAKYRSLLALPELAAEHGNVVADDADADKDVIQADETVKTRAKPDKTKLPTYSTRDKSKKTNVSNQEIPADRLPNYDKVFGAGSGDTILSGNTPPGSKSPEPPSVGSESRPDRPGAAPTQSGKHNPPTEGSGQPAPISQTGTSQDRAGQTVRSADRSKVQDTVIISDVQVGEVVMDATTDAMYRQMYVFDTQRISELNGFRDELESSLLSRLQTEFGSYGVKFTTNVSAVRDENTRLLFDIVKYRPGEFNLIKNIPTNMTVVFRIVNPLYHIDKTFRRDFSCEASAYYPNEKARLNEIADKIVLQLQLSLSRIRVKDLKAVKKQPVTDDVTNDGVPMPPGTAPIPSDERIVPINNTMNKKGLKSAGIDH